MNWLFDRIDGFGQKIKFCGKLSLFNIAYIIVANFVLFLLPKWLTKDFGSGVVSVEAEFKLPLLYFFKTFAMSALFEESVFRLPVVLLNLVLLKWASKSPTYILLYFCLFSSVIFGYIHGNVLNIFIQGVGGFLWCVVALRCGFFYGVFCHFFYNMFLLLPLYFLVNFVELETPF